MKWGRAACGGGCGQCDDSYSWLCNHSNSYLKHVMAGLPYIKISFFKTLIALKVKSFWNWLQLSCIQEKILGRYAKYWIFHQNNICSLFFKVGAWLYNHAVCKIGLRYILYNQMDRTEKYSQNCIYTLASQTKCGQDRPIKGFAAFITVRREIRLENGYQFPMWWRKITEIQRRRG